MMPRPSHPPTVLTQLARSVRVYALADARILVAVSGGRDSMVLLHALAMLRKRFAFVLHAHAVHHGLRAEADDEVALVAEFARAEAIPFSFSRLTLERGKNLQARARTARYDALAAQASSLGAAIVTAHHEADQAETVLLALLRSSRARALAAMRPTTSWQGVRVVRPLLGVPAAAISAHAERHHVRYNEDPSNHDLHFLRVRVRREVLPLLSELNPRIVQKLAALAAELAKMIGPHATTDPDPSGGGLTPPRRTPPHA